MKSDQRHELQKNVLADKLGHGIEQVQPYSKTILGIGALALVGLIGWGIYSSVSQKRAAEAWTEYYFNININDPEAFEGIADQFPGSTAALWAQQTAGDELLIEGVNALYRDRDQATKLLDKAIEAFKRVESSAYQPELRARAALGLAQAHESLGKLDQAKTFYQQVSTSSGQPEIVNLAKARLEFLNSEAGKEFYVWFDKLKPQPIIPPTMPNLSTLPDGPDLKFEPVVKPANPGLKPENPDVKPENPDVKPENPDVKPANPDVKSTVDPSSVPPIPGPSAQPAPASPTGTEVPLPTATPTETPAPATETPAPATETPAPATETPAPPATETPAPPVETPAPPANP